MRLPTCVLALLTTLVLALLPGLTLPADAVAPGLPSVMPASPPVMSAPPPVPPASPPVRPSSPSAAAAAPRDAIRRVARAPTRSRFRWPLPVPHPVVRPFAAPASPYGPGHRGTDLAGQVGAPVFAAEDGVVVFAGPVAGRGVVSVEHEGNLRTTYEPLIVHVTAGQRVVAGGVLGLLLPGHVGCAGACLHWGARRGEEYLDPLRLLTGGRVRLLPWEGRKP